MSIKVLYKGFEIEAKLWLDDLEKYNDIPFAAERKEWSMAELYSRLYDACVNQHAIILQESITHTYTKKGRKSLVGYIVFLTNKLSKSYFKKNFKPSTDYVLAEDTKSAKGYILKCMKIMHALSEEILKADPKLKIKDNYLGWLTLEESYAIPEMYFSYYRKMKERIEQDMIAR
ncbi:MAG: hypothetical protein AB8B61_09485 [Cyclobacteriaceae bacterium]